MPRFRIDIEYDGGPYFGWQRQAGHHSVQAALETAIAAFSGEEVTLFGAGRTDTGVHALGQVAHFDLSRDWPARTVQNAVNARLAMADETVAVLAAAEVPAGFDARFSAKGRHYLYRIHNRRPPLTVNRNHAWHVSAPLDAEAMHAAAQRLVGTHDFTTFRAAQCQAKSPIKTLDRLEVTRDGEMVEIRASARSFLHNQVRSFAGTLKRVGEGGWSADDVTAALEARDRKVCGPVAPPHGLYLVRVDY
ncbi:tRNA pseudouridine(38-40) synthase TruA [Nitratireductor sp. ZSWI3]|uniref:tRNA pseudouridine(38-40) synthase TruA n=1 Tax=Nitratireductor sp. ZSWI3 TaxID=2966359 RepID=UPI00215015B5|nr:tRNA pseudouridine(38-40) synthase TruA [Nitratireductor sp. ZSWI3]MCR4265622.1 tRNA pseudouridine(38-40) synthase TruA [Nitratireductor sp. ZSWI3]